MPDFKKDTFPLSVDECVRWTERLQRYSTRFEEGGDIENAKLMRVCSILMDKLTLDVASAVSEPIVTHGAC